MITIAIKLFLGGALKRLLSGLTALWGLIRHHPKEAAIIALLALSAWQYRGKRAAFTERDAARAQTAQVITAGQQALAAQIKLHDETKAAYAAKAKEANDDYAKDIAAANTAGDKYAAANRVRGKACVGRASQTSASAEVADPGVLEVTATEALVAITRADFDKCTALYPYANGAYKWGVALREAGLAE